MKNKIFKYDFLIVGAGLVGSLAAIALHQKIQCFGYRKKQNIT